MKNLLIILSITVFTAVFAQSEIPFDGKSYRVTDSGVIIAVIDTVANGARMVMVQPITDKIIRIRAVNADTFPDVESLMIEPKKFPEVKWELAKSGDTIILKTSSLHVKISTEFGRITFCDTTDKPILTEFKGGGKVIEPITIEGKSLFRICQQFESPEDEAFYGLGQQQEGLFNYKGQDVDLYQYNTKISIPFVVSNKNYGILWDNYSRTKFGDIRDYRLTFVLQALRYKWKRRRANRGVL